MLKGWDFKPLRIRPGTKVIVHQDEGPRLAKVVCRTGSPTLIEPGEWIDIDSGSGVEGMPSYLLERA